MREYLLYLPRDSAEFDLYQSMSRFSAADSEAGRGSLAFLLLFLSHGMAVCAVVPWCTVYRLRVGESKARDHVTHRR